MASVSQDERTALLDRIGLLERKVAQYDALIERIMMLMAKHPLGRQLLKHMAESNQGGG